MAASNLTRLDVTSRAPSGSRAARRMRHAGLVPGVLYGGADGPVSFAVDARVLRTALAATGAVLELSVDGGSPTPAVVKDTQRHVVRGQMVHVDLVRVRLDQAIQATVAIVLTGAEESPGVIEGGVVEHITHTVTVEASEVAGCHAARDGTEPAPPPPIRSAWSRGRAPPPPRMRASAAPRNQAVPW